MITFATIYFRHHYDILSSGHIFAVIEFAYKGVCIVGQRFRSNSFGTSEIIMGFACRYSEQLNSLQDLSLPFRENTLAHAHTEHTHARAHARVRTWCFSSFPQSFRFNEKPVDYSLPLRRTATWENHLLQRLIGKLLTYSLYIKTYVHIMPRRCIVIIIIRSRCKFIGKQTQKWQRWWGVKFATRINISYKLLNYRGTACRQFRVCVEDF